jgi:hypothetical protein
VHQELRGFSMIDLKDTTFVIPVKIEHPDRANNLKTVVDYLTNNLDTNIIIHEQDSDEVRKLLEGQTFQYMRSERTDDLLHRTKQLNDMVKASKTPIVVNYDADVLVEPSVYNNCATAIRQNQADMVLPYSGPCYNVPTAFHENIRKTNNVIDIDLKKCHLMNPNAIGGAVFFNREKYIEGGLENERCLSWGYEDNERLYRFKTLGYRVVRTNNVLFHLTHHRSTNSIETPHSTKNAGEFARIRRLSPAQLRQEVNSWTWTK